MNSLPNDGPFETVCLRSDEAAWLAARKEHITASDSGVLTGFNKWGSVLETCGRKLGELPPLEQTPAMEFGLDYEQILAGKILADMQEEGLPFTEVIPDQRLIRSTEYPWMACTLDDWLLEDVRKLAAKPRILELKTTRYLGEWEDGVPEHVWAQLQHQLVVTGETEMYVGVHIRESCERYWAPVELSERYRDNVLLPVTEAVWDSLKAGKVPEEKNYKSPGVLAAIAALYRVPEPSSVTQLQPKFMETHYEFQAAKAERLRYEKLEKELGAELRGAIKGAEYAQIGTSKTWYSLKRIQVAAGTVKAKDYRQLTACKPPKDLLRKGDS